MTPSIVRFWLAVKRAVPVTVRFEPMVAAALTMLSVEPSFRLYFQAEGTVGAPKSSNVPPLLTVMLLAGVTPTGKSEVPGFANAPKASESMPPLTTMAPSETAAETMAE